MTRAEQQRWMWGYAVRLDWPDGSHDLCAFQTSYRKARVRMLRNRDYWRSAPLQPDTWSVVATNLEHVQRHRSRCTLPGCPAEAL